MSKYCVYDVEYTASYFEVGFFNGDKYVVMELPTAQERITAKQKKTLQNIFKQYTLVGFNSQKFDNPILQGFYQGLSAHDLYKMGSNIIETNENRWWVSNPNYNNNLFDSIDIMKSVASRISLKAAGSRLGTQTLIDIPVDFDSPHNLTEEERAEYITYNKNDLNITWQLLQTLMKDVELKKIVGAEIGKDCRSKNNPAIAQMYLKHTFKQNKPTKTVQYSFDRRSALRSSLTKDICDLFEQEFDINPKNGSPVSKNWDPITIGGRQYEIGVGGLHSIHTEPEHFTDTTDIDVTSFYPSMLVNFDFNPTYTKVYHQRLEAKRNKDKTKSDMFKLILNSSYGKLGDMYSTLYNPELLIKVTLTGQLQLLELIARLTDDGAKVIYANTDGVVVTGYYDRKVVEQWEADFGLNMEYEDSDQMFIRDVNNLFAISDNKVIKQKGVFAKPSLMKGFQHPIVYENVMRHFTNQDSLQYEDHKEQLLLTRGSKSWCSYNNNTIGKVVRWIWVKNGLPIINDVGRVANSDSCYPVMDLNDINNCEDIDYDRYREVENELIGMFT